MEVDEPTTESSSTEAVMETPVKPLPRALARFAAPDTPLTQLTPAFHKRVRLSSANLVDSPYNPFRLSDDEERESKRPRMSWGGVSRWKLAEKEPSPPKMDEMDVDIVSPQVDRALSKSSEAVLLEKPVFKLAREATPPAGAVELDLADATQQSPTPATRNTIQNRLRTHSPPALDLISTEVGSDNELYRERTPPDVRDDRQGIADMRSGLAILVGKAQPADNFPNTEQSEPTEEEFPASFGPSGSRQGDTTSEETNDLSRMPPPLPPLQIPTLPAAPDSFLMPPPSALPQEPPAPEIVPLQSTSLPLPSPFPGEQLSAPFGPAFGRPLDFNTPPLPSPTGLLPDASFQFGFGFSSQKAFVAKSPDAVHQENVDRDDDLFSQFLEPIDSVQLMEVEEVPKLTAPQIATGASSQEKQLEAPSPPVISHEPNIWTPDKPIRFAPIIDADSETDEVVEMEAQDATEVITEPDPVQEPGGQHESNIHNPFEPEHAEESEPDSVLVLEGSASASSRSGSDSGDAMEAEMRRYIDEEVEESEHDVQIEQATKPVDDQERIERSYFYGDIKRSPVREESSVYLAKGAVEDDIVQQNAGSDEATELVPRRAGNNEPQHKDDGRSNKRSSHDDHAVEQSSRSEEDDLSYSDDDEDWDEEVQEDYDMPEDLLKRKLDVAEDESYEDEEEIDDGEVEGDEMWDYADDEDEDESEEDGYEPEPPKSTAPEVIDLISDSEDEEDNEQPEAAQVTSAIKFTPVSFENTQNSPLPKISDESSDATEDAQVYSDEDVDMESDGSATARPVHEASDARNDNDAPELEIASDESAFVDLADRPGEQHNATYHNQASPSQSRHTSPSSPIANAHITSSSPREDVSEPLPTAALAYHDIDMDVDKHEINIDHTGSKGSNSDEADTTSRYDLRTSTLDLPKPASAMSDDMHDASEEESELDIEEESQVPQQSQDKSFDPMNASTDHDAASRYPLRNRQKSQSIEPKSQTELAPRYSLRSGDAKGHSRGISQDSTKSVSSVRQSKVHKSNDQVVQDSAEGLAGFASPSTQPVSRPPSARSALSEVTATVAKEPELAPIREESRRGDDLPNVPETPPQRPFEAENIESSPFRLSVTGAAEGQPYELSSPSPSSNATLEASQASEPEERQQDVDVEMRHAIAPSPIAIPDAFENNIAEASERPKSATAHTSAAFESAALVTPEATQLHDVAEDTQSTFEPAQQHSTVPPTPELTQGTTSLSVMALEIEQEFSKNVDAENGGTTEPIDIEMSIAELPSKRDQTEQSPEQIQPARKSLLERTSAAGNAISRWFSPRRSTKQPEAPPLYKDKQLGPEMEQVESTKVSVTLQATLPVSEIQDPSEMQDSSTKSPEPPEAGYQAKAVQSTEADSQLLDDLRSQLGPSTQHTNSQDEESFLRRVQTRLMEDASQKTQEVIGFRTPISYYAPLSVLPNQLNSRSPFDKEVDVIAVVTKASSEPKRADKGARDYHTQLYVVDPSTPDVSVRLQIFRPFKAALPKADAGDIVLIRQFEVIGTRGGAGAGLISGDESSWCIWRMHKAEFSRVPDEAQYWNSAQHKPMWEQQSDDDGDGTAERASLAKVEEMTGPPVEIGREERDRVKELRAWWQEIQRKETETGQDSIMSSPPNSRRNGAKDDVSAQASKAGTPTRKSQRSTKGKAKARD